MSSRYLFLLFFILLSGCSSLSQDECIQANWTNLGFSHGEQGYTFEHGREIISACSEFGITAKLDDYQAGYKQGLAAFCEPENGFTLGLRGDAYNGFVMTHSLEKHGKKVMSVINLKQGKPR